MIKKEALYFCFFSISNLYGLKLSRNCYKRRGTRELGSQEFTKTSSRKINCEHPSTHEQFYHQHKLKGCLKSETLDYY